MTSKTQIIKIKDIKTQRGPVMCKSNKNLILILLQTDQSISFLSGCSDDSAKGMGGGGETDP